MARAHKTVANLPMSRRPGVLDQKDATKMSAMGQKQSSRHVRVMSALPPIADIRRCRWDVRLVPK